MKRRDRPDYTSSLPWVKKSGDRRMRIDAPDIIKTVLTSAVISSVVMYGTQRVMESELKNLKDEFRDLKQTVESLAREQARRKPMADFVEEQMRRNVR